MKPTKIGAKELRGHNPKSDLQVLKSKVKNLDFCHYTSLDALKKIIKNKEIWASSFETFNDSHERKLHEGNKRSFVFCVCCSKSEQIPLWYLYSGGTNGGRFRITPASLIKLIKSIKTVYPVINGIRDGERPMHLGIDFTVEFGWVYYSRGDGFVNHRTDNYIMGRRNLELFVKDNLYLKDYEWNYEKEFRIIVNFVRDVEFERIAIPLDTRLIADILLSPECDDGKVKKEDCFPDFKVSKSQIGCYITILSKYKEDIPDYLKALAEKADSTEEEIQLLKRVKDVVGNVTG
ncbi:MAG: hypothetical protein IJY01_00680 [Clostridia bacterium]|nr:hypothetical protein [Clostridia bacterium]